MKAVTMEKIQKDVSVLRKEVREIRQLLSRYPELREGIVRELEAARRTPKKQYISHEQMRKEFA